MYSKAAYAFKLHRFLTNCRVGQFYLTNLIAFWAPAANPGVGS
jgi:hypothetical protein